MTTTGTPRSVKNHSIYTFHPTEECKNGPRGIHRLKLAQSATRASLTRQDSNKRFSQRSQSQSHNDSQYVVIADLTGLFYTILAIFNSNGPSPFYSSYNEIPYILYIGYNFHFGPPTMPRHKSKESYRKSQ